MAVTAKLFSQFPKNLGGGDAGGDGPMDLLSDIIRQTLHTTTFVPSQTGDEVKGDLSDEVANGNGYTTNGATLGSKTYVTSSLRTVFDAADTSWPGAAFDHRYAVFHDDTVATPADPLIGWIDNGGTVSLPGTDLVYQFHATDGVFYFDVA